MKNRMVVEEALAGFFAKVRDDPRIGTTHISLYMGLFHLFNLNDFRNPVEITRAEVMAIAKIGGLATYHRCMRDLVERGYIGYIPSFIPTVKSQVFINQ